MGSSFCLARHLPGALYKTSIASGATEAEALRQFSAPTHTCGRDRSAAMAAIWLTGKFRGIRRLNRSGSFLLRETESPSLWSDPNFQICNPSSLPTASGSHTGRTPRDKMRFTSLTFLTLHISTRYPRKAALIHAGAATAGSCFIFPGLRAT